MAKHWKMVKLTKMRLRKVCYMVLFVSLAAWRYLTSWLTCWIDKDKLLQAMPVVVI